MKPEQRFIVTGFDSTLSLSIGFLLWAVLMVAVVLAMRMPFKKIGPWLLGALFLMGLSVLPSIIPPKPMSEVYRALTTATLPPPDVLIRVGIRMAIGMLFFIS